MNGTETTAEYRLEIPASGTSLRYHAEVVATKGDWAVIAARLPELLATVKLVYKKGKKIWSLHQSLEYESPSQASRFIYSLDLVDDKLFVVMPADKGVVYGHSLVAGDWALTQTLAGASNDDRFGWDIST